MKDLELPRAFRVGSLGVYRVDMKTREIFTVSEKFKGLSMIDQKFINLVHRDLSNSDIPLENYPAIFRSLSRQYQSSYNSSVCILSVSSNFRISLNFSEECILYKIIVLFRKFSFLENIHGLVLNKHPANNFIDLCPTLNDLKGQLKELESYTETFLPEMARNWVDKNKVGELSIYSREGYLLVDYLKSLINKKWEELNGKDTIKL